MGTMSSLWAIIYLGAAFWTGQTIVKILPFSFGKGERYFIATALGLIVAAEATRFVLYLTHSLTPLAIAGGIGMAALVSWVLSQKWMHKKEEKGDITKEPIFWIVLILIGGYILLILWTKVLHSGPQGALMIGPPMLYGDTPVHVAYTTKLAYGSFPPDNPLFAGTPLVYPYMTHLVYAIFLKLGLCLRFAMFVPQAVWVIAFLTLCIKLMRTFCQWRGTLVASMVLFLGSGLGFVSFFNEWRQGASLVDFMARVGDLTHNGTYGMHLANMLTGVILPGRTIVPGMVIGLLIILLLREKYKNAHFTYNSRFLILIGFLLGILPLWHTHTFIFFAVAVPVWFISQYNNSFQKKLWQLGLVTLTAFLIALPALVPIWERAGSAEFMYIISGWMRKGENVISFWWRNSFLLIPMSLGGWLIQKKYERLFFLPSMGLFVVANLISFQPLDWDNIKLIAWVMLFWSILIGVLYERILKAPYLMRVVAFMTLLIGCISGFLSIQIPLKMDYQLYSKEDQELASWVKIETKPEDIFLTEPTHNHPVSNLGGRSLYMGYTGTLWTYGIDYGIREEAVNKVFSGQLSALDLVPPVSYVVTSGDRKYQGTPVYQNEVYRVFKVQP